MRKINLLLAGLALSMAVAGCSGNQTKETETSATESAGTEISATETEETETEMSETETESLETETEAESGIETDTEAADTEADTEAATDSDSETEAAASKGVFGAFETKTMDGEAVDQSIFTEADLTMVNIWGTFCSPCIKEMPDLAELASEYEEKGVRLIGIVSDVLEPGNEAAQKIIDATKADYTHLILSESLWNNYLMRVQAVPTTLFVDREGKQVGQSYVGFRSKEEWSEILDEKLEKITQ